MPGLHSCPLSLAGYSLTHPGKSESNGRRVIQKQAKYLLLSSSAGSQGAVISSGHPDKPTHPLVPRLELAALDRAVERYFSAGLAASTSRVYSAGINKYLVMCHELSIPPTPASELLLCKFVTYLALHSISSSTIKVYLSGVRQLHTRRVFHLRPRQPCPSWRRF